MFHRIQNFFIFFIGSHQYLISGHSVAKQSQVGPYGWIPIDPNNSLTGFFPDSQDMSGQIDSMFLIGIPSFDDF